ncbi:PLP-dependent aminotransferase family protein [Paraburkholderia sp. BCC1886]|uniref:aminotransferase-like domain-containing protein n=1 Tax=Paraburkholderia sp. BCC1886 TaxID=2562670 RepID=UPI00118329E2|nr:PLP-dependent aminotransferase family protein [Paraburkholderia sp. BCC1886]
MQNKRGSLADGIARSLRQQIADGAFRRGEKLPSIRDLVRMHGYSKNTVVEAYEQLVAIGEVRPKRGAGYFVSDEHEPEPAASAGPSARLREAIDTVWMLREQTNNDPLHLPLGHGIPPASWLADCRPERYQQQVLRASAGRMHQYGNRFGYTALRQVLERRLYSIGIHANANQIVTTNGANHAMDLIIRCLLRAGDTVLVDEPGYYPLFGKIKLHGAIPVGVPRLADGPDLDVLEHLLKTTRARLFFTQSVGQNPTGSDTAPSKAHRILQLADRYDMIVVENDPLADLKPAAAARIATLDQLRRTVYIGSFTKSVSASLRVGFVACHTDLADDLADVKMLVQVSGSEYSERLLDTILRDARFTRYISKLKARVKVETEKALKVLDEAGATLFAAPQESLYLWATLDAYPDSMELVREMLSRNISLAPGAVFYLDNQKRQAWCRYNVGYTHDPRFVAAIAAARR